MQGAPKSSKMLFLNLKLILLLNLVSNVEGFKGYENLNEKIIIWEWVYLCLVVMPKGFQVDSRWWSLEFVSFIFSVPFNSIFLYFPTSTWYQNPAQSQNQALQACNPASIWADQTSPSQTHDFNSNQPRLITGSCYNFLLWLNIIVHYGYIRSTYIWWSSRPMDLH